MATLEEFVSEGVFPTKSEVTADENINVDNKEYASEKMSEDQSRKINLEVEKFKNQQDSQEESEDTDDPQEMETFFNLMGKADRRHKRRSQRKQFQTENQFNRLKSDWRNPQLRDPDDDTSDSDDEDDNQETRRFLGLMQAAKNKTRKPENNKVNLRWSNGKLKGTLPPQLSIRRLDDTEVPKDHKEDTLVKQRRKDFQASRQKQEENSCNLNLSGSGKRKFGARMNLVEAKLEDFDNSVDYVDFLNSKLKNVHFKVIK
jgi:hypothetical protein